MRERKSISLRETETDNVREKQYGLCEERERQCQQGEVDRNSVTVRGADRKTERGIDRKTVKE